VISISILVLLLLLALPSMSGVIANRRLKRTLDSMNEIVRTAQERSVTERRAYIIEWQKRLIVVHPETPREGDPDGPTKTLALEKGYAYTLRMPAALEKGPFAQWIFWPSGTCEPATGEVQRTARLMGSKLRAPHGAAADCELCHEIKGGVRASHSTRCFWVWRSLQWVCSPRAIGAELSERE
jgi:type II secretory pathway pseudopilin PulG